MIRRPAARSLAVDAGLVGAAVALVFGVTLLTLRAFTVGVHSGARHELVIEAGTAARIARGENPDLVPPAWTLYDGDVVVLDNRDSVTHRFAGWAVYPQTTLDVPLSVQASTSLFCSLHPAGRVALEVLPAAASPRLAMAPTVLVGSALGIAAVFVRRMLRLLRI